MFSMHLLFRQPRLWATPRTTIPGILHGPASRASAMSSSARWYRTRVSGGVQNCLVRIQMVKNLGKRGTRTCLVRIFNPDLISSPDSTELG